MAGRVSAVLRDRFEVAKRSAELRGTVTAIEEVRAQVLLAVGIVKDKLRPIDRAAAENDIGWLARTYPDWNAEWLLLSDEKRELQRLLDHLELVLSAVS
jgi:hypothetical protein